MELLRIIIDISYFSNKGMMGRLIGITPRASEFIKGKLGGALAQKTQYLPVVGKKIKKVLGSRISYDNEKITLRIKGKVLDILYKNLYMNRIGNTMKIIINVDKLELDELIDSIADTMFGDNKPVCDFIKTANESSQGDAKYELVQLILDWINKHDMLNEVIGKLADRDEKIGNVIKPAKLRLGDISVEY